MAHPAPPKPTATIDPIRQQLDELDALLQKMLTLPVAAPEAETGAADPKAAPPPPESDPEPLPPLPPLPPPRTILSPPIPPGPSPEPVAPVSSEPSGAEPPP